ncbi:MAG: hypothetical protein V8S95_10410 [Odoribacter sp.]
MLHIFLFFFILWGILLGSFPAFAYLYCGSVFPLSVFAFTVGSGFDVLPYFFILFIYARARIEKACEISYGVDSVGWYLAIPLEEVGVGYA